MGIPKSEQARIFEPFVQVGGADAYRVGGTGLGLAIVRRIVDLMHGEITLSSEPGKGATFNVTVTLGTSTPKPAPIQAKVPEPKRLTPRYGTVRPERILVAEDNEVNRMLATAQLEELGYGVDHVGDGVAAVVAARTGDYSLILMDSQMPQLDGLEATRQIRAAEGKGTHVPIVAMSANASKGYRELCLAAGMNDYISKPVVLSALQAAVEKWLQPVRITAP
jgi:CheY-like chemotaxis protein